MRIARRIEENIGEFLFEFGRQDVLHFFGIAVDKFDFPSEE